MRINLSATPLARIRRILRRPVVAYRHRGLRPADVVLVSYPRSGSNWLRFILYEILTGGTAEFGGATYTSMPEVGDQSRAEPTLLHGGRFLKSHEKFAVSVRKVIYLVRDPRDILLSEHRAQRRLGACESEEVEDSFVRRFTAGQIGPFGSWDRHVSYWRTTRVAREGRLLLIRYEDLRSDPHGRIASILEFLGASTSPEHLDHAIRANSLKEMRAKETTPPKDTKLVKASAGLEFVGGGRIAGWRSRLSDQHASLISKRMTTVLASLGYPTT